MYIYTYTYVYTYVNMHIYVNILNTYKYTYIHIHIYTHSFAQSISAFVRITYVLHLRYLRHVWESRQGRGEATIAAVHSTVR